jgi:hypothetical protein
MCGIQSADWAVFPSAEDLPDAVAPLFATASSIFSTPTWWRTVLSEAMPEATEARFLVCRTGTAMGLFPLLFSRKSGLRAFTTPYTCEYAPLIDGPAVFETFGRYCRGHDVVRLDAIPAEWPHWDALTGGLRAAGLVPRRFDHFGNWHEDVTGLGWAGYLSARPGALRETIRRRLRHAERRGDARFSVVTGTGGLEQAITSFETVYASSWKEPEPFPAFNAASMRAAAGLGILRLGVWTIADIAVAVQFWIVEQGRATVLKLAHDETYKAFSPGTVLTALMLRHLLDHEAVREIDFGRGDDPYKQGWAGQRRKRDGLLIVNPRRIGGILALARHDLGRLRRRLGFTELA